MKLMMIASAASLIALGACTSSGNTERGALGGAALGGLAGAVIGNNVGKGDAKTGAAVGAAVGAVAGGAYGNQQDRTEEARRGQQQATGPGGEPLVYDRRADRYYYTDRRSGYTYWANGEYRG